MPWPEIISEQIIIIFKNLRNGGEPCIRLGVLNVVLEAAEHQHAHAHEHEQEAQVLPTGPHRVGDGLEPHRPPGQLEDPLFRL